MATTMSPSTITDGQIGKLKETLDARLRKSKLPSDLVQQVLEHQGDALADELVAVLQRRIDAISDLITRTVTVNRDRAPKEALEATGRALYVTDEVVDTMPQGDGDQVEIVFFKLGRFIKDDELKKEYVLRGLVPVDPYALAAFNEVEPSFADEHFNCTHWKNSGGQWCYVAFDRWDDGRFVNVDQFDVKWNHGWFFAGRRKS